MTAIVRHKTEDYGQLGPAMKALPNDRWRAFVEFYLLETYTNGRKDNYGAQANAARKAGFGNPNTIPRAMAHIGWRLMSDDRMIAAVAEESRKLLRSGAPDAVKAVLKGVRDREHKDHARFVSMVLDRADPITTHQHVEVVHKHINPDQEALEELRALKQLGTSREKLIELFGGNGLARIEALEAADTAQRARDAKVIDGEASEINPEPVKAKNSEWKTKNTHATTGKQNAATTEQEDDDGEIDIEITPSESDALEDDF